MAATMAKGTRPGTSESQKISGWTYIRSQHPAFAPVIASDRESRRWEESLAAAEAALETALARVRVAHLLVHGGHVDKGLMARSGLSPAMDPEQVLDLCVRDLPTSLPSTAYVKVRR